MHACVVQSRLNFQVPCLQVCAAASQCTNDRDYHRGPMMVCTCVSHYRKLQILLSKSRMFCYTHFVISSMRKKLLAICDSRKTPGRICKSCNDRALKPPPRSYSWQSGGMAIVPYRRNLVLFIVSVMNVNQIYSNFKDIYQRISLLF